MPASSPNSNSRVTNQPPFEGESVPDAPFWKAGNTVWLAGFLGGDDFRVATEDAIAA
jgi:hypothetical protein